MDIRLSWDLFILVFFVVIVAYSFIIGRDGTLKVILGTYIAAIASNAFGNLFEIYFSGSAFFMKILKMVSVGNELEAIVFVKVIAFIMLVILFAVRGAFEVHTTDDRSSIVRLILLVVYSIFSAGLIISCILLFVQSGSLIVSGVDKLTQAPWDIYNKSNLIRIMVNHRYLWFSLPALSFLIHSLYSTKEN